jgi:amidohydrolase
METKLIKLIQNKATELSDYVSQIRKQMHQFPELSFREIETAKFVCSQLDKWSIPYEKDICGTGIVAFIKSKHYSETEECIALRSELDALPIHEENTHDFISKNQGVMHACGHDVHTSILLGCAKIISDLKDELPQSVKLIFQLGEEQLPGGASLMIQEKVLENPKVKEIIALHVYPEMPVGEVGFKAGLYMASCDEIHLEIIGKGGHGATPQNCIDPIAIGAEIVMNLQQIVSRKCDPKIPCVLSFGHFEALGATNVIPSKAILKGTFRTMNEAWRNEALELIENQINSLCEMNGAKADLKIIKGYPFLENNERTTQKVRIAAEEILGNQNVKELPIRLTSEDFSYYAQEIPACFFRLGVRNEEKGIVFGVHHPKFDVDESCFEVGMKVLCNAVFQ